ncbi:MAG: ferritin family protein [Candidatus Zixiibacteriota bacterium]
MIDDSKTLAEALQQAAMAEREGHSFYIMAAHNTQDPKGKVVFETLAREEMDHLHFLKEHYDAVIATGKLSPSAHLGARIDLGINSPIFTSAIKSRIREAHFEMTALAVGIQLERDATAFYQKHASEAQDPQTRKLFSELAAWESGHYQALLKQQEELKTDYWSGAGFSPF